MKTLSPNDTLKERVWAHWQNEVCGIRYGESDNRKNWFKDISRTRYRLEPYIPSFADFPSAKGKHVLEIGVGAGVDFCNWIDNGAVVEGIDLTEKAIALTMEHLRLRGLDRRPYSLSIADVESLPFFDNQFDLVYSWGVLHHTPDTERAFAEAFRVLRPGGVLKAMVYHRHSWVSWMLWLRYSLLVGKPFVSVSDVVFDHLESPGTKVYTRRETKRLLSGIGFKSIDIETRLSPGDLLDIKPSSKYESLIYRVMWMLYPTWLVRIMGHKFGLYLTIRAGKPLH